MNSRVKFAVFSDCHLGFNYRNQMLCNDSFNAFDESLKICVDNDVDFVLHCGDLFDSRTPQPFVVQRTISIAEKYVMGQWQHLDPINYGNLTLPPNWIDENYHIRLPIFIIDGNHDDACMKQTSPIEILSESRLVNYISGIHNSDSPSVRMRKPISLRRGDLQINIYGIPHMLEDELKKSVKLDNEMKIEFEKVEEVEGITNISILLIHQDIENYGKKDSIRDYINQLCPDYIDLVICGHDHQRREPMTLECGVNIFVPGSTLMTQMKNKFVDEISVSIFDLSSNNKNALLSPEKKMISCTREFIKKDEFDMSECDADEDEKVEILINDVYKMLETKQKEYEPYIRIYLSNISSDFMNKINKKAESIFKDKIINSDKIFHAKKLKKDEYHIAPKVSMIENKSILERMNECNTLLLLSKEMMNTILGDYLKNEKQSEMEKQIDKHVKNAINTKKSQARDTNQKILNRKDAKEFINSIC